MRGVPRRWGRAAALPVVMADHCASLSIAGPVSAGGVGTRSGAGRQRTVSLRAGQDVVLIGIVAPAVDHRPLFREGVLFTEAVHVGVQMRDVLGDDDAFRIHPWSLANPVTRVDRRLPG